MQNTFSTANSCDGNTRAVPQNSLLIKIFSKNSPLIKGAGGCNSTKASNPIVKFLLLLFFNSALIFAQNPAQYFYLDESVYPYIDYLINSGKTSPNFIFSQPFEKTDSLFQDNHSELSMFFKKYWNHFYRKNKVSGHLELNNRINYTEAILNRYKLSGSLHYANENITLANRTTVDQNYKYDPLFAGDLSESDHWLYGRVNDAYINFRFDRLNLFFGRIHRNWGPINSNSLILSNNPYTYDHFLFSYSFSKIKLSLIFAQLENLDAVALNFSNNIQNDIPNARKFMVGHRLDINIYDNFQLAFTEMAMYGGPDRDIDIAFFNPMNFYYALQRNDKKAISGLWALDLFYKPIKKLTLYCQILLDDVVVNNDPGEDDRARFPDRLGLMASVRSGDLLFNGINFDFTFVRIWNRTYQSKVTYENYHYRELGLGYPCASCEEFKFKFGIWKYFPWFIQNETISGRYGSVSFTDVFPFIKEEFPVKPVFQNLVNITNIKYFYSPSFIFYSNICYFDKKNHYLNRIFKDSNFRIEIGAQVQFSTGIFSL